MPGPLDDALRSLTAKTRRLLASTGDVGEEDANAALVEPVLQALGWDTQEPSPIGR